MLRAECIMSPDPENAELARQSSPLRADIVKPFYVLRRVDQEVFARKSVH